MLEEAWSDHAIRNSIAIAKFLLGHDILKKRKTTKRRRNAIFLNLFFSGYFFLD